MNKIFFIIIISFWVQAGQHNEVKRGSESAKKLIQKFKKHSNSKSVDKLMPKEYIFLPTLIKKISDSKPELFFTYLTSSSVPISSHLSFSSQSNILNKSFRVSAEICMIGIESDGFEKFVTSVVGKLSENGVESKGIGFCPELFEDLNITRVPAFVVSVCPNSYTHIEECEPRYILHGDVTLKFALEKLSDENEYFKEMYDAI